MRSMRFSIEVGDQRGVFVEPVDSYPRHLRRPFRWRRRTASRRFRRILGDAVDRCDVVDLVDLHDQAA
jgi:hypothetical protein